MGHEHRNTASGCVSGAGASEMLQFAASGPRVHWPAVTRGLARSPGSVRLLQQLRLPADRQVPARHRLLLLLCSW